MLKPRWAMALGLMATVCSCKSPNVLLIPSQEIHRSVHSEYLQMVEKSDMSDYQKKIRARNVEKYGDLLYELGK